MQLSLYIPPFTASCGRSVSYIYAFLLTLCRSLNPLAAVVTPIIIFGVFFLPSFSFTVHVEKTKLRASFLLLSSFFFLNICLFYLIAIKKRIVSGSRLAP